ncbi:MAG: aldose 1-epimerase family protein [Oscillospiraceae bacterium]|nr:aldose 1-epimerase family protein [Oscillospiraceae bacterium]
MEYTLENQYLRVTVTTWGAQVKSVVRKSDGVEHMWQADPAVWGYHAPILFPYTGKLAGGTLEAKGQVFQSASQHGFARTSEHEFVYQNKETVVLQLMDSPETLAAWPYRFRLLSVFTLEGDTLHHTLTVENRDTDKLYFGIGYHPAFTVPFDESHSATDYELRFSDVESPLCVGTAPKGLVNGKCYYLGRNIRSIPVEEGMFDSDSHCMVNLTSKTLGIYEKDSGRAVVCDISSFPYTLIWSKPGMPRFICIEPWNSLPSPEDGSAKWEEKPAAAVIEPGESWSTTLSTSFIR